MSNDETNGRISVSRDALRADLLDLELRLTKSISESLESKADAKVVDQLIVTTSNLIDWSVATKQGEMTDAQRASVQAEAKKVIQSGESEQWTRTERRLVKLGGLVGVLGLLSTAVYSFSTVIH